jgi:hypothetical protein
VTYVMQFVTLQKGVLCVWNEMAAFSLDLVIFAGNRVV